MPSLHQLAARVVIITARDDTASPTAVSSPSATAAPGQSSGPRTVDYAIVVLGLVFLGLMLATSLLLLRRFKRAQTAEFLATRAAAGKNTHARLPSYSESTTDGGNAGLTIQTTTATGRSSILVLGRDGLPLAAPMLADPASPPHAPANVPQIRITFPDEHDAQGRRVADGRVVVVRLGDHASAVGLEPLRSGAEEQLPAYERDAKSATAQFYSIDMDHIGGLKEKSGHYQ